VASKRKKGGARTPAPVKVEATPPRDEDTSVGPPPRAGTDPGITAAAREDTNVGPAPIAPIADEAAAQVAIPLSDIDDAPSRAVPIAAPGAKTLVGMAPGGSSGSIDVQLSEPRLPKVSDDAAPVAVGNLDSQPVSSGKVVAVAPDADSAPTAGASRKLSAVAKEVVGGGVSVLGGMTKQLGGGVSKMGELTSKVPLVGSGVSAVGETISHLGESLTELPRVARTRRGRLLVRSMFVAFALVTSWIVVIVALQLRGDETPDLRPQADALLLELDAGPDAIRRVYESASPQFQEITQEDTFVENMTDLHLTVGAYKEIAAVNDTLVTTGPAGRIARVSLIVAYEKGKCRVSVSLHWHERRWKLLGIGVLLPAEIEITQAQREARLKACDDPMDAVRCDLNVAANTILEQLRDGRAADVWDNASELLQKQQEKARFVALQEQNRETLGDYRRILAVPEAKIYGGSSASFDAVLEFTKSQGVRAVFGFYRATRSDPWRLKSFKLVQPMPRGERAPDDVGSAAMPEPVATPDATPTSDAP